MKINEPVGVRNMVLVLFRDEKYYGFATSEYIQTGTTLSFDAECGRDEIKAEWEAHGVDAAVEFYFHTDGELMLLGNLKFITYIDDGILITIEIERTPFSELFRTRFDSAVNLTASKTIDGAEIVPIARKEITLHSKRIRKELITDLNEVEDVQKTADFEGFGVMFNTVVPPTENVRINEFGGNFWKGTYLEIDNRNYSAHYDQQQYQFITVEAGRYSVNWIFDFDVQIFYSNDHSAFSGRVEAFAEMILDYPDALGMQTGNWQPLSSDKIFDGYAKDGFVKLKGSLSLDTEMDINQRFYIFFGLRYPDHAGYNLGAAVTAKTCDFNAASLTERPASKCEAFDLVDAFEQNVRIITNRQGVVLRSNFLDAIRGKYCITNGLRIRRFAQDRFSAANATVRSFLDFMQALWGLGLCVTEENGLEVLRIERILHFFNSDYCAFEANEVFEYQEVMAVKLMFNEFETGYEKYAENEYGSIDEYNNRREYLLPIRSYKTKFTKKTNFIASGYLIEFTRSMQFEEKPKDSDSNDDNIFIFTMSDRKPLKCESDEPFDVCDGAMDKGSLYNARISPARMAAAWMPVINSICYHKTTDDETKCTYWTQNGNFRTKLKYESDPISESQNFKVTEPKKFIPVIARFKTPMYAKDYLHLRKSVLSLLPEEQSNGYVRFFDCDGKSKTGWIMQVKYEPYRELAYFEVLLRNEDCVQPELASEIPPRSGTKYAWVLCTERFALYEGLIGIFGGDVSWSPSSPFDMPEPAIPPTAEDYENNVRKDRQTFTLTWRGSNHVVDFWWYAETIDE